jgi:hypothetical protein
MNTPIEGGCVCGGTRYQIAEAPGNIADCHCIDCRRSAGAPYVTWGTVKRAHLKLTRGELRKIPHAGRIRNFAACCGTHLFFEDTPDAATIDVTIASFDDPAPFAPKMAIWTEDRLPWVVLNEKLPVHRRSSRE